MYLFTSGFIFWGDFMNNNTKKLSAQDRDFMVKRIVLLGVIAALSYVATYLTSPVKFFNFLSCDIKDAIIAIASFIFDPLSGLLVTVVVSLLETFTYSQTGFIGCIMNIISTASFVLPAAIIYKKKRTINSAVFGLILGSLFMTAIMLLWNYLATPLYMGVPRQVVVSMLPTVFLPFNLLKGLLNSALTLLLYKTIVKTLRKARLIPQGENTASVNKGTKTALLVISAFVLVGSALLLLILGGVI